ncbi:rhodanese-like domain-containing protein [Pelagicoccus sp. SDUM812002]|uniref:rhodanese-like domain-containing protein n=1 Tax=Pelagicoccus sp. SDUM812002 TaxID=3041266 RepID=UPI00280DA51C|nr:rhodanese-like domain-containing protein [Pelagicoccus sp. SDUM812002]MDQ8186405.1 rhodanese-like domain-containing protein [Pelagicoccus sp. SDUM812002]
MKQALWQSVLILALSSLLGALSFAIRPDAVPSDLSDHEIELSAAMLLEGALWLDARMDTDFDSAHLDGALLLNEENWDAGFVPLLDVWVPGSPIVVYCSSESCLRSHQVAERLREELGTDQVYSLKGGWEALLEAGLVERDAL